MVPSGMREPRLYVVCASQAEISKRAGRKLKIVSLSQTLQQVRGLRNKIELVQLDRTMNAEEKSQRIDELLARRNDLVYQAVNKNKVNSE